MIRVLLFEDNRGLREALEMLIGGTPGFAMSGAYHDVLSAESHVNTLTPDVILMDIDLPGGRNGIEAVQGIRKINQTVNILMLTVFDDDDRIFKAICAGADGYILKQTPPARILDAITEVSQGGAPMSPAIARKVLKFLPVLAQPKADNMEVLSLREKEVLQALASGKSQKMVADELGISTLTIHSHVKKIYEKLHVHSLSEAISKTLLK